MEEIEKWYADKIGKTPEEFDAYDKHIETIIQAWENERQQVLHSSLGAVSGQLPANEEIDSIIEQDLPFSEEYQKYSEKEKILMLAATKAGAKWFRASLIEGNFH